MIARFAFLLTVLLSWSLLASANTRHLERDELTGHVRSSAEELLATRERRRQEFTRRLEDYKQQMEHHEQGHRRLTDYEVERLRKKIKAYSHKLEYLNQEIDDTVSSPAGALKGNRLFVLH
jgi:predicted RNase H-like nuclease (RuvC/YqgF family)